MAGVELGAEGAAIALDPAEFDHLGVEPVWWQATKPDAADPGGLSALSAIVRRSPVPCVAIGGIDAGNAAAVMAAGADGLVIPQIETQIGRAHV